MLFFFLQWNFLVYACFILKKTFVCLGEEIILQTIFFKKKKRIFQITRKISFFFFKRRVQMQERHTMGIK